MYKVKIYGAVLGMPQYKTMQQTYTVNSLRTDVIDKLYFQLNRKENLALSPVAKIYSMNGDLLFHYSSVTSTFYIAGKLFEECQAEIEKVCDNIKGELIEALKENHVKDWEIQHTISAAYQQLSLTNYE